MNIRTSLSTMDGDLIECGVNQVIDITYCFRVLISRGLVKTFPDAFS